MRSMVNGTTQVAMVLLVYAALFKVSVVIGGVMLVCHLVHEYTNYLASKEMLDQILEARNILQDLDNQEEPPVQKGNC